VDISKLKMTFYFLHLSPHCHSAGIQILDRYHPV
jgi:hypothetical protein